MARRKFLPIELFGESQMILCNGYPVSSTRLRADRIIIFFAPSGSRVLMWPINAPITLKKNSALFPVKAGKFIQPVPEVKLTFFKSVETWK